MEVLRPVEHHCRALLEAAWPKLDDQIFRGPFDKRELDQRTLLFVECLLWLVDVGGAWEKMPDRYGNRSNVYQRFNRWCRSGRIVTLFENLNATVSFPYECDGRRIFRKDNPECCLRLSRRRLWKKIATR